MGPQELTIDCPLPGRATHPNSRAHYRAKATAKKADREMAFALAKEQLGKLRRWQALPRATVLLTYYVSQRHDRDNLIAWAKAHIDGLVDAGVLLDDNDCFYEPPRQILDPRRNGERRLLIRVASVNPPG